MAAAQHSGHGLLNLAICCLGVTIEKGLRGHDDAVDAEAALHRLLIDKSLLNRMRFLDCSQTFQRADIGAGDARYRGDAGSNRLTFDDHGTGAALSKTA